MSVPKTAMYEDDLPVLRKDNIWTTWKVLAVEAKTVAKRVQKRAHRSFGAGILASDAAHQRRTCRS
jgi:hypothetical protein